MMIRAPYDERQVVVRDRAWRRTCWLVLVLLFANAIWGPWGSAATWPMLLTWSAMAAQAAQGIWGRAYFRESDDQRSGAIGLAILAGLCGYTFFQYGLSTGQWWDAGNPTRAISFLLTLIVLTVLALRWWVDRRAAAE